MGNKLSEPSDNITDTLNSLRGWKQLAEAAEKRISALLADNEKKEKLLISNAVEYEMSTIDLLAELEEKDKRISELERANKSQDDHINQQQDRIDSLEKTNAGLGRGLAAAEKWLATPVRLPSKNNDEFWFDGVFQVAKFDRAVERAISAAGFKFVGVKQ